MLFTVFFYIFLVTSIVSFLVSFLAWRRKAVHAAKELGLLMFSAGYYSFFIAFETASTTIADKIFWSKMAYPGAVAVPVFYFLFIMRYTGYEKTTSGKNLLMLFILPAITLILTLSNESHHLIWDGYSAISPETNLIRYFHGEWFWVGYLAYDYILLFFATISLFNFIIRHKNIFRRQGWAILVAGICPWIAGIVYVTNGSSVPGLDLAPIFTGVSGVLMIYSIIMSNFLDLAPIAREKLVETLKDGILALDSKNRVQDINGSAFRYLGIPIKDILGLTIDLCGITSLPMLNAILSSNAIDQLEVSDDNGLKTYSISKQEITKEAGSRLVVIRDITEEITIQKEMREGEERYRKTYNLFRLMADNMSDMLWAKDLDKKFIFVNKAICEEILNTTDTDEPIGKTDLFFKEREQERYPDFPEWNTIGIACQSTDEKVIASRKPEQFDEFGYVKGEPLFMDVQKAPIFDADGQMIGIVGSARNATKQKRIEQDIINRDKLLSAISKATNMLIQGENIEECIHDSLEIIGEIAQINRIYIFKSSLIPEKKTPDLSLVYEWLDDYAKTLDIDRTPNERSLNNLLPDWYDRLSQGVIVKGKADDFNPSERALLESQKVKSILVSPVFIDTAFWGFIGFDDCQSERDWTTTEEQLLTTAAGTIVSVYVRKKNQEELQVAKERAEESDRLKTAFLANLSHEIRTPMNGILGFISLLQEPDLSRTVRKEYINLVKEGGERLLNTIHDIIDISKIEARQVTIDFSDVDINEMVLVLSSLYKSGAEAKNLTFNKPLLVPNDQAIVKTDKNKVYSIMSNLIKNAIKYTKAGSIEIGFDRSPSAVRFYVKDTGIGVPEALQKSIFDNFVQADVSSTRTYEGTGLGLSIAKAYVEMLNGKIWCESVENKGSTFYFQIPVSDTDIQA